MPQTPWQLASTETLPPSVEAWALASIPNPPLDFAVVQSAREGRLAVRCTAGSPTVNEQGTLANRTLSIQAAGPRDAGQYPVACAGFALVDTSGPGSLFCYFPVPEPVQFLATGDSYTLEATLIVARNEASNG